MSTLSPMADSSAGDTTRWLARLPWIAQLGPEVVAALGATAEVRALARGEVLWSRSSRPDALVAVRRGRLDVVRGSARGDRMLLRCYGPTELLGLSTIGGAPATADVIAADASIVVVLPGEAVRSTLVARPQAALSALAQLGELVGRLTDEIEELRFADLDTRLLRALARRGRGLVELRVTHDELAQQVGATRENVSRALKRLESRGLLRRRRGRIELFHQKHGAG